MNFFGGGGGSGGWVPRRRRRRYNVARFRSLYDSLLQDIAPPPPSSSSSVSAPAIVDRGSFVREQSYPSRDDGDSSDQQQQQQQRDGDGDAEYDGHGDRLHRRYLNALGTPIDETDADVPPLTKPETPTAAVDNDDDVAVAAAASTGTSGGRPSPTRYSGASPPPPPLPPPPPDPAEHHHHHRRQQHPTQHNAQHHRDLSSAWHVLSATPAFDKEGSMCDTALAVRDDAAVAALSAARQIESRVVESIRSIGEVVIYGERPAEGGERGVARGRGGGDEDEEIFSYFCDKNMLALLVDIAKAKPPRFHDRSNSSSSQRQRQHQQQQQPFSGVVWTPLVKSQVLQTVSILVSNVKDATSLYYLLSNNHVNDLASFLVPLGQWTDAALEEMTPVYISFLKTLALQLARNPHLFQFFVDDRPSMTAGAGGGRRGGGGGGGGGDVVKFPLLHAAVKVAPSSFAQSDAFVHLTALNILLNLCQIPSGQIRNVVGEASADQRVFLSHLCQRLVGRYRRIAHLTVGASAGDPTRSAALGVEIADLQDQLHFVNDLLWCGVRPLNVRLCEYLLRHVLFRHVLPGLLLHRPRVVSSGCPSGRRGGEGSGERSAAVDGEKAVVDDELIREAEAMAQASVLFLVQLFLTLEYTPLLKMVAVAVLHPHSPAEWVANAREKSEGGDYVLTPALNAVVQNRCVLIGVSPVERTVGSDTINDGDAQQDEDDADDKVSNHIHAVNNPYRRTLLSLLRGDSGDRRFTLAAMLLQSILDAEDFNGGILTTLHVLPSFSEATGDGGAGISSETEDTSSSTDAASAVHAPQSPFEDALATFFNRRQRSSSSVSALAMECGGSLALSMLSHLIVIMTANGTDFRSFHERFCSSSLVRGLASSRQLYASEAQKLRRVSALSDAFVDLVELEISRRYNPVDGKNGLQVSICNLNAYGAHHLGSNPEVMVRKVRDTRSNEIEEAKFAIRMALYFRSMCEVVVEVHERLNSFVGPNSLSSRWGQDAFEIRTIEVIDDKLNELVGQKERAQVGTDLDVRGRTFFYFSPSWKRINPRQSETDRKRRIAEEILMRATPQTELMIVLDPTELFVLQPNQKDGSCNRGTILCSASLRSIITAAPDKEWLHIAIRQMEDVGVLIKNGNMSLRFDSVGTCLIVKQYLERCRSALRSKLMSQVGDIFDECSNDLFPSFKGLKQQSEAPDDWGEFTTRQALSNLSSHLGEGEEEVVLEQAGVSV